MKIRWTRLSVVVFWLAMTGWLIRYEAFPGAFTNSVAGYRSLFKEGILGRDTWMKILFQNAPIGYSHSRIDIDEASPDRYCTVVDRTVLNLHIMGESQKVTSSVVAVLRSNYQLAQFTFSLVSGMYSMRIKGERAAGDLYDVAVETGAQKQRIRVRIPDDAVLYSPMTEMSLKRLKPGDKMNVKAFDPTSQSVADVRITALREESFKSGGGEVLATVLSIDFKGMEVLAWMDRDGTMLRQETPFGWTLVACPPDEALAADRASGGPSDLLAAMAVPTRGEVDDPRHCRALRVRLSGAPFGDFQLARDRQTVESSGEREVVLRLTSADEPGSAPAHRDGGLDAFLAPTLYIQSDHPRMLRQAQRIVGTETNPLARATAIYEWVYRNVAKNPTVSVPSALDVLQRLEGDCNEHTYLFVGLARAAGLPAKVVVGLTYARGAFYYHAWPAVYAGRWLEMDPTLGQPAVDATHIALLEGELKDQLKLMQVFGRLKAEILPEGTPGAKP